MTDEHVHDFQVHDFKIEGREEPFRAGMDCTCGRCPRGVCDGTGVAEPGWSDRITE